MADLRYGGPSLWQTFAMAALRYGGHEPKQYWDICCVHVYNSQNNSIAPSKRGFVVYWGLSQSFGQALLGTKSISLTSYM